MFILKVETIDKTVFELTHKETDYQILSITGLNPPQGQINMSNVAGMDGSLFNSSKLQTRNIVITIKINGDVEKNRLKLYNYFRTKEYCKIYYKNSSRNVYIEGYVENVDSDYFTNNELVQISIICPNPYFKDLQLIVDDISKVVQKFKFPFSINVDEPEYFSQLELNRITNVQNVSESETGLIIDVDFYGSVRTFEIRNTLTGEQFILDYTFNNHDNLIIDCNIGIKSVKCVRDGVETNLIPYLRKGSKFFQLRTGDNNFTFLADSGESDQLVSINFKHYNVYRGV